MMSAARKAWPAAMARFAEGYGGAPDLSDPTDVAGFLPLLEAEIRLIVEQETDAAGAIEARTARLGGER